MELSTYIVNIHLGFFYICNSNVLELLYIVITNVELLLVATVLNKNYRL